MDVANSDDFSEPLEELQRSCFGTDIHCGRLGHQHHLTHDIVRTALPEVRQVTNIRKHSVTKMLLGEVHKLLRLYLTLYLTSATSERTFSALRNLKNYLRRTMKQDRLKNCLLMHCHKSITGTLDTAKIAKTFSCANELRKLSRGMRLAWCTLRPLPPSPLHVLKRSTASEKPGKNH